MSESASSQRSTESFPSTYWSRIAVSSRADEASAAEALEVLARRYSRPIAAFIRRRFAKTDEDATDAAQEFFVWMMQSEFLKRADPERGSFRGFIKKSLTNFLHDLERKKRTWKRGGNEHVVSLESDAESGDPLEVPDTRASGPEEALDESWRRELLAQAESSLEAEFLAKGKQQTYTVFREYFLGDEELDYATLAERHGLSKVDISNALANAKRRYRAHLRDAVRGTVRNDEDLRAELSWLFEESTQPTTNQ